MMNKMMKKVVIVFAAATMAIAGSSMAVYANDGNEVVGFADAACKMTDGTILYQFDPTTMSIDEFIRGDESDEEHSEEADRIELHQDDGSTAIIFKNEDGKWYDIHGNEFWENEASIWFNLTDNSEWYY